MAQKTIKMDNILLPHTSSWPLTERGIRLILDLSDRQLLARNPLTKDCFSVGFGYYPNALNHVMERSTPSDFILLYCTSGHGTVTINHIKYSLKTGDLVCLRPQIHHQYQSSNDTPWTLYWCHIRGSNALAFTDILQAQTPRQIGVTQSIIQLFTPILMTSRSKITDAKLITLTQHIKLLLTSLADETHKKESDEGILAFETYLLDNLSQPLSLADMADYVDLPVGRFCRIFKQHFNETPKHYFNKMKINHAVLLLQQTELSIRDIGRDIGFEDPYHFSRLFKQIIGCSPKKFRAEGAPNTLDETRFFS